MIVLKYPMALQEVQAVEVPMGASLLKVAEQEGALMSWWLVHEGTSGLAQAVVYITGTGQMLPPEALENGARYIDTVLMSAGYVQHVFMESPMAIESPDDPMLPGTYIVLKDFKLDTGEVVERNTRARVTQSQYERYKDRLRLIEEK